MTDGRKLTFDQVNAYAEIILRNDFKGRKRPFGCFVSNAIAIDLLIRCENMLLKGRNDPELLQLISACEQAMCDSILTMGN